MKTLSKRFRFVVLGLIVIVVVGCCCFPTIPSIASYSVEIGNQQKGPKYVPWKDQGKFDDALRQLRSNPNGKGKICICVLMSDHPPHNTPYPHPLNNYCKKWNYTCDSKNIRTVKVTKSKAADEIAAGESAANDPNVMYKVQSADPGDIKQVLDALEQ
jgi:hypothetical protein